MKRLALLVVLAVVVIALIGCKTGSKSVTQMIHADPESTWAAVKKVISTNKSVTPASVDEEKHVITIKHAFGDVQVDKDDEGNDRNSIESYDAVISMTTPESDGSNDPKTPQYTFLTIKISQFRPTFSTPVDNKATAPDDNGDSYGFTITSSSEVHDKFFKEVRKELEVMKANKASL